MLSVLHSQYRACWCSGDFRSQGISRHGIDPKSRNIPSPASEELTSVDFVCFYSLLFFTLDIYCYSYSMPIGINSLAPGKYESNFRHVIFKQILVIDGWGISCEIALIWMSPDFTDDQSTLVQVMAWCRQATSHYLSQCWPRSLSPYGVTRPQWVN